MTYPQDWDTDALADIPHDFNAIFAELWEQAKLYNLDLLPEDIENETYRIMAEYEDSLDRDTPDPYAWLSVF